MRNIITKFLQKIKPKVLAKPLGRWNIEYCNTIIDRKIDLSNEDHCGPCGEYAIKMASKNKNIIDFDKIKNKKFNA